MFAVGERRIVADFDALLAGQSTAEQHKRPKHPSGWDPHVEIVGDVATAVSEPTPQADANSDDLIRGWQLDPAEWRIVGNVNVRRWQRYDHEWLYYYKADLQRIDPTVAADTDALFKLIRTRKPRVTVRPSKCATGDVTFLVLIGDTQIGKGDGDGSEGTVRRWMASLEKTVSRAKKMSPAQIAVAFMGDLREGCTGNYPGQKFTADLTVTQQDAVLQELVFATLDRFAAITPDLLVMAVPGNHGEERDNGKAYTLASDNHDVAVVQTVARGIRLNRNGAFDHVRFLYPSDQELTVAVDLSGVPVGFAHGHQFRGPLKAETWWKDQAHAKTRVGDCDLLISGHYHHLKVAQGGQKTWIQIPALDGGSIWWENLTGQNSPPGMVSMLVGEGLGPAGCGWDDLKVI